jgi:hypothetical protein
VKIFIARIFFYFYTTKPLWVGDFRAKKIHILIFRGYFGGFFFEHFVLAQVECAQNKNFQARAKILSVFVYI